MSSFTVTKHARERWQQRVNPNAGSDAEQQLLEAIKDAEYVADEKETGNSYYIGSDHWLYVVNVPRNTIITVIEIDYGFPAEINKTVTDKLRRELKRAEGTLKKAEDKVENDMFAITSARESATAEIERLEAELRKLEAQETELKADCTIKQKEYDKLLKQLVYSISYRTELLALNKKEAK
jgi:hypothetical protein